MSMKVDTVGKLGILLGAVVALSAGCGYNLVGRASNIPEDIKKVFAVRSTPDFSDNLCIDKKYFHD